MPRGDLEVIRAGVEAVNRGDMDAWLETIHPEIEFVDPPDTPDDSSGTGREAALASIKRMLDVAEEVHAEIEEVTETEDGRLLVTTRVLARGKGSGVPLEFVRWDLITVRDEMIARNEIYLDRAEALAAAGLEP